MVLGTQGSGRLMCARRGQPVPSVSPGMLAAVQQPFASATFTNRMGKLRHGGRGRRSMATNRSRSHRPRMPGGRSQELEAAPALPGQLLWLRMVPCWCAQLWGPTRKGPLWSLCSAWAERRSHGWVPPGPPMSPLLPHVPLRPTTADAAGGAQGGCSPPSAGGSPRTDRGTEGGSRGCNPNKGGLKKSHQEP